MEHRPMLPALLVCGAGCAGASDLRLDRGL